jgi:hypothetical protein
MLVQDLQLHGQCFELSVLLLSEGAILEYLRARFPQFIDTCRGSEAVLSAHRWQSAVLVSVVQHLLAQGVPVERDQQWHLIGDAGDLDTTIPEGLRYIIAYQLDRLTPGEKRVVEAASIRGVEFTAAMVAAGLDENTARIEAACDILAERGHVLELLDVTG